MGSVKVSEIKGRAVIVLAQAEKIGTISDVILDPSAGQVIGLKVRTGLLGGGETVRAGDVRAIGVDAVTVDQRDLIHAHGETLPDLTDKPDFGALHDAAVVSHSGERLGVVADVEFDTTTFAITHYTLAGSLWQQITRGEPAFSARPGIQFGKGLLVVPDAVAAELKGALADGEPAAAPEPVLAAPAGTPAPPAAAPAPVPAAAIPPAAVPAPEPAPVPAPVPLPSAPAEAPAPAAPAPAAAAPAPAPAPPEPASASPGPVPPAAAEPPPHHARVILGPEPEDETG